MGVALRTGGVVSTLSPTAERHDRGLTPPRASSAVTRGLLAVVERLVLLVAIFVVWQLIASNADSIYFPPPLTIFERAQELWLSGSPGRLFLTDEAMDHVLPSVARMVSAWAIGVIVGVVLGTALGLSPRVSAYLEPSLHFVRSLPAPALIPVFMLVLGIGSPMRVALAAFGVVWIVMINTAHAVGSVDALLLDTARAFHLSRPRRLLQVTLPAASPAIFAAMHVGLSLSLILMVLSEMVAGMGGIGAQLMEAQNTFSLVDVWATMLLLGVLGIVLNGLFSLGEHRALAWHRGARAGDTS